MEPLRVVALVGSLRAASLNRRLFEHVLTLVPEGMVVEEASIRGLPVFDDDLRAGDGEDGFPDAVAVLRARVRSADAVLFVSPEYNYSIPAPLKNAIDWVSRAPAQPFADKAVAMLGASPGRSGTMRMQYHLRQVLVFVDAHPINKPEVMVSNAAAEFGEGATPNEATSALIRSQLEALGSWARRLRE